MEILCLIIAIIIVVYRKFKGTIISSSIRKFVIKTIALALSLILIITIMIKEAIERLLEKLGQKYEE